MKLTFTDEMGPIWVRGSKHGKLVRGLVREDGRIFWAYQAGREIWLDPKRFKEYLETQRKAAEKFGSEKNVQCVRNWRKKYPERQRALRRRQMAGKAERTAMRKAMAGFRELMKTLTELDYRNSSGDHHLRLRGPRRAAEGLKAYLEYVTKP